MAEWHTYRDTRICQNNSCLRMMCCIRFKAAVGEDNVQAVMLTLSPLKSCVIMNITECVKITLYLWKYVVK